MHRLALGLSLICPALIALPPRRLDLLTMLLSGTTVISLNHLHAERYGYSIPARFSTRPAPSSQPLAVGASGQAAGAGTYGASLPTDKARALSAQFREARERQREGLERDMSETEKEVRRQKERGLGEKVWYGSEGEGWAEKREREIKEKFEEGKGIGDVIWEQVWEVWNWGDKSGEGKEEGK